MSENPNPPQDRVVVVTPEGMGVVPGQDEDERTSPADMVEEPAKVMRIGSMVKQLLEEVRSAPLDEAGRARLAHVHDRSITELEKGLSHELVEELRRITTPFAQDQAQAPSDAELRIAHAQLVGWLEGLFHGIQTALVAQQMAARAQLQEMRRALPAGPHSAGVPHPGAPGMPGPGPAPDSRDDRQGGGTGQYL
jgi:hypothetical protein